MTIEFNCHVCGKLLRTADNKAGRTAKCPGCGESLTVPAADVEDYGGGEADESDYDDYGDVPTPSSRGSSTKACPMCGEQISRRSTRCEFCGENVGNAGTGGPRRRSRSGAALEKVAGPAIGLMVTAGIGIAVQMLGAVGNVIGMAQPGFQRGGQALPAAMQGGIGLVFNVIALIIGIVIILGAVKMKRLESYGMAMTATITAMIPCISPCCLIGLPIGIWGLVVLNDVEVKNSFRD